MYSRHAAQKEYAASAINAVPRYPNKSLDRSPSMIDSNIPLTRVNRTLDYIQGSSNKHLASELLQKSRLKPTHLYSDPHNVLRPLPLIGTSSLASLDLCPATAVMSFTRAKCTK